jgi:hypothetical protein
VNRPIRSSYGVGSPSPDPFGTWRIPPHETGRPVDRNASTVDFPGPAVGGRGQTSTGPFPIRPRCLSTRSDNCANHHIGIKSIGHSQTFRLVGRIDQIW